ncbi:TetR/AcrR family transcriptional regulator [candidate division KSB1 bacterium]|nr:TetR/AcrR family transcriptional regulator [candidate division KSB1 bacterium]
MRHGIRRVSIDEICRKANVSKMTFYKHFPNKIELAKYIVIQLNEDAMVEYRSIMEANIPYVEKVQQIVDMKICITENMSQEFFNELTLDSLSEIHDLLIRYRQANMQAIIDDFSKAQQKGDIRQDIHPQFLLYILNKIIEMSTDKQLLLLYDSPKKITAELVKFFFYGIVAQSNQRQGA